MSRILSVSLAVLAFVALATAGEEFNNDWDGELNFECKDGQVLSSVYSVHDNGREDRRWRLGCRAAPAKAKVGDCEWTDFINNFDEPISFMCPANGVIAGIYSVHANAQEDRRMKFKCCSQKRYKTWGCGLTGYLNDYDAPLDYTLPKGQVLVGWASVHDNHREDRIHKMLACGFQKFGKRFN